MTDKICVVTICQNEIELLPYTLQQSLKFADKVIVINGGTKLSTDGTTEYLNKLYMETNEFDIEQVENKYYIVKNNLVQDFGDKKEFKLYSKFTYNDINDIYKNLNMKEFDKLDKILDHKLLVTHGIFGDHTMINNWDKVQRNAYLDILEEIEWDGWIFLIDADETYTDEHWLKIKEYVKVANKNNQIMIRFPYIYFFKDLNHTVHGGGWDTLCHHLSIYEPGFRYWDVSTLLRNQAGKCLTHYPSNMIMEVNDINLYHYSHNASYKKEKERIFRYRKRGDLGPEVSASMPDNIDDWNFNDTRESEMSESKVKLFYGSHPIHMQPYIDKYNKNNR